MHVCVGKEWSCWLFFCHASVKKKKKAHLVVLADGDVADVVLLAELLAEGRGHQTTAHAVQKESKAWERERERRGEGRGKRRHV